MSEFTQAMKVVTGRLGLYIDQWPSGKFGFTGSMPANFAWESEDQKILREISQSSCPSMCAKVYGVKVRAFETEQEARAFAEANGADVIRTLYRKTA